MSIELLPFLIDANYRIGVEPDPGPVETDDEVS